MILQIFKGLELVESITVAHFFNVPTITVETAIGPNQYSIHTERTEWNATSGVIRVHVVTD